MKLWERVQVNIAVVDIHLPTKDCGVHPQTSVRQLHTFRPSRGSARVVNCGGRIFIGFPWHWLSVKLVQHCIRFCANNEFMLRLNIRKCFLQFWVNDQNFGTAVLDDVFHFFGDQTKVNGNQNTTKSADPKKSSH